MIEANVPPGELHRIDASVIHFDAEGHVLEILTDDEDVRLSDDGRAAFWLCDEVGHRRGL